MANRWRLVWFRPPTVIPRNEESLREALDDEVGARGRGVQTGCAGSASRGDSIAALRLRLQNDGVWNEFNRTTSQRRERPRRWLTAVVTAGTAIRSEARWKPALVRVPGTR